MAPKRVRECNVLCTTGVLKAGLDEVTLTARLENWTKLT
jgi:hypothetical protein